MLILNDFWFPRPSRSAILPSFCDKRCQSCAGTMHKLLDSCTAVVTSLVISFAWRFIFSSASLCIRDSKAGLQTERSGQLHRSVLRQLSAASSGGSSRRQNGNEASALPGRPSSGGPADRVENRRESPRDHRAVIRSQSAGHRRKSGVGDPLESARLTSAHVDQSVWQVRRRD